MFYTLPAHSAQTHNSHGRPHVADELPLLLTRSESDSSIWSFPENRLSSKLLRGLKRITTRGSLRREAASASASSLEEKEDSKSGAPALSKMSSGASASSTYVSSSASSDSIKHPSSPKAQASKSSKKPKKDREFLKRLGQSIVMCMGTMYAIPAGAPMGRNYTAYGTPAPIFW
jgi:hypothetical protein